MNDKTSHMTLRRNLREPTPPPTKQPEVMLGSDVAWAPADAIVATGTLHQSVNTERGMTLELHLHEERDVKLTFMASRTGRVTGFTVKGDGRIELVYA